MALSTLTVDLIDITGEPGPARVEIWLSDITCTERLIGHTVDGSTFTGWSQIVAAATDVDLYPNSDYDQADTYYAVRVANHDPFPILKTGSTQTLRTAAVTSGDVLGSAAVLDTLADVDTTTTAPEDGQALVYDETAGMWVPGAGGGGGAPSGVAGGVLGGTYPNPSFAADMATQTELNAHTADTADAHAASAITNTPAGTVAAVTVQAAIDELGSEKVAKAGDTMSGALAITQTPSTTVALSLRQTGDAAARFTVDEAGKQSWGDGTNPADAFVARTGAATVNVGPTLVTDSNVYVGDAGSGTYLRETPTYYGAFNTGAGRSMYLGAGAVALQGGAGSETAVAVNVNGDSGYRFTVGADGTVSWGTGSGAVDTTLSRSAAGVLATTALSLTGLAGATAGGRFVGFTATVAPTTGTWAVGDMAPSVNGKLWMCTVAGTPGTWAEIGAGSFVQASTLDANTLLGATVDNTPIAFPVAASRIVGRKATGDIDDMTTAEVAALFGTPTGAKFLADDGTLKTPAGGSVATDTIWDAVGDLAVGTGADTAARLAKGTQGQILTVDTSTATDLAWADGPWLVPVPYTAKPYATTGTWALYAAGALYLNAGQVYDSTPAINNYIAWKVHLAAGTWTFRFLFDKTAASGISTVSLGGSTIATVDAYNGSTTRNNESTTTGIVVAATGVYELKFLQASKNASSSNYGWYLNAMDFTRTA